MKSGNSANSSAYLAYEETSNSVAMEVVAVGTFQADCDWEWAFQGSSIVASAVARCPGSCLIDPNTEDQKFRRRFGLVLCIFDCATSSARASFSLFPVHLELLSSYCATNLKSSTQQCWKAPVERPRFWSCFFSIWELEVYLTRSVRHTIFRFHYSSATSSRASPIFQAHRESRSDSFDLTWDFAIQSSARDWESPPTGKKIHRERKLNNIGI